MPFYKGHKFNVGRPCSPETREKIGLANRRGRYLICQTCKKEFWAPDCWIKANRKYCSWRCNPFVWKKGKKPNKTSFQKGSKNLKWKGGKYKNWYRRTIYSPSHPRANKRGYLARYVIVMEKHLGRFLKPKEVVHHINKIKDDDRLENLMLFPNHRAHLRFHCQSRKNKA